MSYTVRLFAHDSSKFAEQVRRRPEELIKRMRRWAKRVGITPREFELGLRCIRELWGTEGYLDSATEDHFWALCWVAESVMERISIPELSELKGYWQVEQYGIVPGLLRHRPPYPLPRVQDPPPAAGFLPWSEMENYQFTDLDEKTIGGGMKEVRGAVDELFLQLNEQLTGTRGARPLGFALSEEQIRYGRDEFRDLLETLIEDRLDLLVVIV